VGTPDLLYFLGRFGTRPPAGSAEARADFNGNGTVETLDLAYFLGRYSRPCP